VCFCGYLCGPPFSAAPGSSSNCVEDAGPNVFQSRSAQTTRLSGVTSIDCTPVCNRSEANPDQLSIKVLPLASRATSCTVNNGMPGKVVLPNFPNDLASGADFAHIPNLVAAD